MDARAQMGAGKSPLLFCAERVIDMTWLLWPVCIWMALVALILWAGWRWHGKDDR